VQFLATRGYAIDRATVRQRKTGRPVRFELTGQTRQAIDDYKRPRDLLIDTRVVMVPLAAGLAAFGRFLLVASRRRRSQAKDHSWPRHVDIACRGKPDAGTQDVSRLAVPPIGPRITLRTVAGQRQVNII
jgi:hypothetical protein